MSDFIPAEDTNFSIWAQAFSNGISADPGRYMLTPAIATSIAGTVTNFMTALLVASTESTRTKPTVADKDDARFVCETMCRQYAGLIRENAGILDSDKIAIGVRPENPVRERIDPPTTQPLINVLGNTPGVQTVVYADTTTPDSKAKPHGCASLQLFCGIGTTEPLPFSQCQFYGAFGKNPIDVNFGEEDDGKIATYYARWANPRGENGPVSIPVCFRIAA